MIPYKKKLPSPFTRQQVPLNIPPPPQSFDPHKKPWFQARKYLNLKDQDFKRFLQEKAPFNHYSQKLILKKYYRQAKCTNRELFVTSKSNFYFYKSLTSDIRKITYSRSSNIHRQKIKSFRLLKYVTTLDIREYPNAFTSKNLQYLPNLQNLSISLTPSKLKPMNSLMRLKLRRKLCLDHLNLKIHSDCFSLKFDYASWILQCLSAQKDLKMLNLDAELRSHFGPFSKNPSIQVQNYLPMLLSQNNLLEFQIRLRGLMMENIDLSRILQTVENLELCKESFSSTKYKKVLLLNPDNKLNIPNMLNQAISLRKFTCHQSLSSVFSLEQIPDYLNIQHLDLLIADLKDFRLFLQLLSHIKSLESLSLNLNKVIVPKPLFDSSIELPALKHLIEFNLTHSVRNSEISDIFGLNELQTFSIEFPDFSASFQQNTFTLNTSGIEDLENFSKSLVSFKPEVHSFKANLQKCSVEKIHSLLESINSSNCFKQVQEYFIKIEYDDGCPDFACENILGSIPNSTLLQNLTFEIRNRKLIALNFTNLGLELFNLNDLKAVYQFLSSRKFNVFSSCSIVFKGMNQEMVEFLVQKFNNLSCFKTIKEYSLELNHFSSAKIASHFLSSLNLPNLDRLDRLLIQSLHLRLFMDKPQSLNVSLADQELIIALKDFLAGIESDVEELSLIVNEVDSDVGKALKELNTLACLQKASKYSFCSHSITNTKVTQQKNPLVDPKFLVDFKIPFLENISTLILQCSQCLKIKYDLFEGKRSCKVQFQSPLYLETFNDFANDLGTIDRFKLTLSEPDETVGDHLRKFHQHSSLKHLSKYSLNFENPILETLSKMQISALEDLRDFHLHIKGKSKITLSDVSSLVKDLKSLRDLKVILNTCPPHPIQYSSLFGLARIENLKVKLNFQKDGIENLCHEISALKSIKRLNIESVSDEKTVTFKSSAIANIPLNHLLDLNIKNHQQNFTLEDFEKYKQNERSKPPFKQNFKNHKRYYYS